MLQQNLYDENRRYIKWMIKNISKIMFNSEMFFIAIIILSLLVEDLLWVGILFAAIYTLLFLLNYNQMKLDIVKKPLVVTSRIKRLLFTLFVVYALIIYLLFNVLNIFVILSILGYLHFIIILLVQKKNITIEKYV